MTPSASRRARLYKALFENRTPRRGSGGIVGPQDWLFYPALMAILATVVLATDLPLSFGLDLPEPVWPVALAFAWPLIRPSFIAPLLLGVMGLFLDYFWGAPLGFYVISLMAVHAATLLIRSYIVGQDTWVVIGAYSLAVLLFFTLGVVLTTLDSGVVPRLISVFEQMFATWCLVVFVLILLDRFLNSDVRFN
jgi:rod shape-determining protein MreD